MLERRFYFLLFLALYISYDNESNVRIHRIFSYVFEQLQRCIINTIMMSMKKAFLSIGVPALSIGVYQGWKVRTEYVSRQMVVEEPLPGPHCGVEHCSVSTTVSREDGIFDKGLSRIRRLIKSSDHGQIANTFHNRRKIKLVILGDSLAFGIGCDEPKSGPILPKFLARVISTALNADVDWVSDGKIGGTVSDIRNTVLPAIKSILIEDKKNYDGDVPIHQATTELIVIVICGLNDWKEMLEKFPFGFGPVSFKEDLSRLVDEIKQVGQQTQMPCKIFLPSMPLACTLSDPQCSFRIAPLHFIVSMICWIWDLQKHALAFDDPKELTTFIGAPPLDSEYAVPGHGNISADGIHPTNQGYKWWAMHMAEAICLSVSEK